MRGLRTVPHLWAICEDMLQVCPNAIMLQYVNPMAINTWAISAKYPQIRQVGLCHSVQGTAEELARDLDIPISQIRYRAEHGWCRKTPRRNAHACRSSPNRCHGTNAWNGSLTSA